MSNDIIIFVANKIFKDFNAMFESVRCCIWFKFTKFKATGWLEAWNSFLLT